MNSHAVYVKMAMSCRLTCRSPTFASACFCISIRMLIMVLLSASSAVVLPSAAWNTVTNVAYCHQSTVLAPTRHTASVADDCSRWRLHKPLLLRRHTLHRKGAGQTGVGRYFYVGFTPMWERTICGFRAGRRGCAASLLCRHINQCN